MRIAYVGHFAPGWATETDLAVALERAGHRVVRFTESDPNTWQALEERATQRHFDLLLWTTAHSFPVDVAGDALARLAGRTPSAAYHLDRWFGLRRQHEVASSPFFRCDVVVTADGGHDAAWAEHGIRHHWLSPAVDADEAQLEGQFDRQLACDVAFVGNWRRYHPEWPHRRQLVAHLRNWFGDRLGLWPDHLGPVRGQRLADLYASARVVVGDSCLAGSASRYWSDRVPECLGRGGFLLHPAVDGLDEHYKLDEHLVTWDAGNWRQLRDTLDHWLADDDGRARVAAAGRAHVLEHHTYDVRARQLVELVHSEGLV